MNAEKTYAENSIEEKHSIPKNPQKWWQWILVYPTLVGIIISAIPTWVDIIKSKVYEVPPGYSKMAEEQNDLWRKNLECSSAPTEYYETEYNIKVDATICKSGDILVKVLEPNGNPHYVWVPVQGLINERSAESLLSNAYAVQSFLPLQTGQSGVIVLCQKFLGQGRLLRRVRDNNGCFDEIINTFNGRVIQRNPAPCNSNC